MNESYEELTVSQSAEATPIAAELAPYPANPATGSQYFEEHVVATLPSPWSMAFLPDGRMLVTERPAPGLQLNPTAEGHIRVVTPSGAVSSPVTGLPANAGILDVILDPHFEQNHTIYFSFMDRDPNAPRVGRDADDTGVDPVGIAVVRAVVDLDANGGPTLTSSTVIWHQFPDIVSYPGSGEPGGRLTFSPDGTYLFIAAGDRQEFGPVQGLDNTLGKIIRIYPDGTIPADNPFVGVAGALPEIWSLGHRNPYGLVFGSNGLLWENEMGPMGGDELNVIEPGANYGWPNVSYGNNYDGSLIPKPADGDGYAPSSIYWVPVIAPSGMIAYSGDAFPQWSGDLIISGLQSKGLVVVDPEGMDADEITRIDMGVRTRAVAQGPDGTIWILTDQANGQLIQLSPRMQVGHDGDFNGDGRSDILWRNGSGSLGDWHGDTGGGFVVADDLGGAVSTDWRTIGRGDFDGDGRDDILWRNGKGAISVWTAAVGGGFTIHDGAALHDVSNEWAVVGIGDFNGDGHADILWRNTHGITSDWLGKDNGDFLINDGVALKPVSLDWHVVGTGDFNGDGRDDILWRNNNGALSTWSGTITGNFIIHDGAASQMIPRNWLVAATGDFNGDGRGDILWRNVDGTVADWLGNADGTFTVNTASARGASADWHMESIGDYNGDGYDDILWRNEDGTLTNWLGSSTGAFMVNGEHFSVSITNQWHVQSDITFM